MSEYTEGVCVDSAAILKDGAPMSIREILAALNTATSPIAQPAAVPLVKVGQIKVGDLLRFNVNDKKIDAPAVMVIRGGTDGEEIVYNRKKNHYFITSMVLDGTSNHKDVMINTNPSAVVAIPDFKFHSIIMNYCSEFLSMQECRDFEQELLSAAQSQGDAK